MCRFKIILALLILLRLPCALQAQSDQYRFSKIDVNHGLSHNQVKCFLKDSKGFMWIGTLSGLNRYDGNSVKIFRNDPDDTTSIINNDINNLFEMPDGKIWLDTWTGPSVYDPLTETFTRNTNRILRKLAIPEGNISIIKKDAKGNYWFVHATQGLFKYIPSSQKTIVLGHDPEDTTTLLSNQLAAFTEDPQGNFWIMHINGVLEKMDGHTLKIVYRNDALPQKFRSEALYYNLMADADGDLWVYTISNYGIFNFKPAERSWSYINNTSKKVWLNTDLVRGIAQDSNGLIWVATDHGGINLIDKNKMTVRYILHHAEDEKSLSQNSVNVLYKDNEGVIWAGTYKNGAAFYHPNIIRFKLYRHESSNPASLPFDDINAFAEDDKGNLWIGTNGGGLIYYDREKNRYRQFLHQPGNSNSLSNNVIVSLLFDRSKKLWIGTYFGGLDCYDGERFIHYKHDAADPGSISDNSIWEMFEDSQGALWVGTLSRGVDILNKERQKFYHYRSGDNNSIHSNYIPAFMEDKDGNMWIGTGYGIDVLEKHSGRFIHYLNESNNASSLSNNSVLSIIQDSRGLIWIGTHGGLNLFDQATRTFRVFKESDGLPHSSILTILEDNNKNLWVSTPHGISNVIIDQQTAKGSLKIQFRNYGESDGLQGKQFNESAACKTRRGELIFGGANGFNVFRPEEISLNTNKPRIILTDFQIFNKSVKIGEEINGKIILNRSITETQAITLQHKDNVFSLEFVALSFFHPQKNQYKYMLEGFDKSWQTTDGTQRKVTYTNLDPGEYVFKVIASNNDGIWNEDGVRLVITVLPPFWKTRAAFVLYILAVFATLLVTRKIIQQRERLKFAMEQERQEAQRMHELDMMKIRFFTNVSHEFRTPLTLILTPIEKLLKTSHDADQQSQFQLIHRNARRLLNLVNQLLDFRKLEVQEIKFNPSEGDIVKFIKETVFSFSDLSEKKDIKLDFQSSVVSLETIFDQDKLEKILFNLLSNAFKFTAEHGEVSVSLMLVMREMNKWLEIKVSDTGIGIPADKQEKIFERFFQHDLPRSVVNQGSGIGLSITKEFVSAHGGTVSVESEVGKGSCFTILLPVKEVVADTNNIFAESSDINPVLEREEEKHDDVRNEEAKHDTAKLPTLLLVEDNEDFRFYLKDNLKLHYNILEAKDGLDGWNKTLSMLPDLIVSDVMMPEMNGIELCRKIKNDQRVSHVPVILLTARTAEEQKLEGFETGADDYITKPFNFEILQSRIRNLIHKRELSHKDFRKKIDVKASSINITSLDEKLIQNAIKCVEDKLADADFSVEDLSHELGMSRVHLYKKLQALTGKSPLEFMRSIRLQHAAQLLEKSQLTVSEIAYKVGFNNPKYFAKYFKEEYNLLPSAYASAKRNGK